MSAELHALAASLEQNISSVVLGKRDVVRLCVVALLAGEHILIEDVPGVGKTLLGKALGGASGGCPGVAGGPSVSSPKIIPWPVSRA